MIDRVQPVEIGSPKIETRAHGIRLHGVNVIRTRIHLIISSRFQNELSSDEFRL